MAHRDAAHGDTLLRDPPSDKGLLGGCGRDKIAVDAVFNPGTVQRHVGQKSEEQEGTSRGAPAGSQIVGAAGQNHNDNVWLPAFEEPVDQPGQQAFEHADLFFVGKTAEMIESPGSRLTRKLKQ